MDESIRRLEEKIAHLEQHVGEQDRAMFELSGDLKRLHTELAALRRLWEKTGGEPGGVREAEPPHERPPHY